MKQSVPKKGSRRDLIEMVSQFCALEGRQPRVMISGQGRGLPGGGAAHLAVRLADLGFNVDFGPLSPGATELYRQALDSDVDIICLLASTHPDAIFIEQICNMFVQSDGQQIVMALFVESGESGESRELKIAGKACLEIINEKKLVRDLEILFGNMMDS